MMKVHTTNYIETLIEIAADSPIDFGQIPPLKGLSKTAANLTFEMINQHTYQYTSDDVLFQVHVKKNNLLESEQQEARHLFFSKGQPCFRASALTKRYGWGIHHNNESKIAIYGAETPTYKELVANPKVKKVKAMKSSK